MTNGDFTIALVGVGGFGTTYVDALLAAGDRHATRFVGGVDPYPERAARLPALQAAGVPVYDSMDALYAAGVPDLTILSSPISLHAKQTAFALERGSHVLCEKPIAATPAEADAMRAARDKAGRHVAIGYQWSFSAAIQRLKADALAGVFGRLKRMKCVVLWPRDEAYYARNDWAGAIKNARGEWVLDSPVNNACAHYLHNMLYVAGGTTDLSATPRRVTAELYRANPIGNFDTAALRIELADDAEAFFYVSHAGQTTHHPVFTYEYEHATVTSKDEPDASIVATFNDGRRTDYGTPGRSTDGGKLWMTVAAIRAGRPSLCGIEAATPHCRCVWACQESAGRIKTFAADELIRTGVAPHRVTSKPGLDDALMACFERAALPSELGLPWAVAGVPVDVDAE